MTLPELVVVVVIGVVLAYVLVKLWRPLLTLAFLAAVVLAILWALGLPPFDSRPGRGAAPPALGAGESPVSVADTGGGLIVVNHSQQALFVRASMTVSARGGRAGVCNPFGPPGNRTVPMPGPARAPTDQLLLPLQRLTVQGTSCPNYSSFSVWCYDTDGRLVFETHR